MSLSRGRAVLAGLAGTSFPALALLYAALYAAFGTVTPFMPSFLAERGLDPQGIGIVLAAGTAMRIAAGPIIGATADRLGTRAILAAVTLAAGIIGLLYLPAAGLVAFVAISMTHASVLAGLSPLSDAIALPASIRERAYSYGAIRGIGSAAYVLATLGSGWLVTRLGLASINIASSALFLAALPVMALLPPVAPPRETTPSSSIVDSLKGALAVRQFRIALPVAALVIGSQAMSDTFAVIHWRAAGVAETTTSALVAEAVCSEIVVFLVIGPILVRRLGPAGCAALSAAAGVLRWTVFAETTAIPALAFSELLQGLTFALMQLAVMAVVASSVPARFAATAQTLYGAFSVGLAAAIVTVLSGPTYARLGGHAFLAMAAICLCALPMTPFMRLLKPTKSS